MLGESAKHIPLGSIVLTMAALAVFSLPLPPASGAHHSFAAEFDRDQPVEVTGTVTRVEWTNPHARFYVDVAGSDGETVNWNFELTTPNILIRRGWTRSSLEEGDTVTVKGFRARNSPYVGNASEVTLADGRNLFTGSAPD
jgi:hypothetical protein